MTWLWRRWHRRHGPAQLVTDGVARQLRAGHAVHVWVGHYACPCGATCAAR